MSAADMGGPGGSGADGSSADGSESGAGRLVLTAGAATDVGRVREHQEDAYLVTDRVFAVADGMGGHAAGEVASALAIEAMAALAERESIRAEDVVAAVEDANDRIRSSVTEHPGRRGMGTTLTGLALVQEDGRQMWAVFNVGDSRVYRLRGADFERLTVDHSEVQELLDAGLITAYEAAIHPARNIITRSLGTDRSADPDVSVVEPGGEETFLLCSDGLSNEVGDRELATVLRAEEDPQAVADRLCAAAIRSGGRDNITVVVVRARLAEES
jgi:protein phosphatase